jgi:hypothetical protein
MFIRWLIRVAFGLAMILAVFPVVAHYEAVSPVINFTPAAVAVSQR